MARIHSTDPFRRGLAAQSIPQIPFVIIHFIFLQQSTKLVFERFAAIVAILPTKVRQGFRLRLDPLGRLPLDLADEIGHRPSARHEARNMDMVLHSSDPERWRAEMTASARQVSVHFPAQGTIREERSAVLGQEHDVEIDLGQRLWNPLIP